MNTEFQLEALLKEYQEVEESRLEILFVELEEIEALQDKVERVSAPFEKEKEEIKHQIDVMMSDRQKTFKVEGVGSINYRKAYTKTSWNTAKLEGLALVHTEINECRKNSNIPQSVTIKLESSNS